MKTRRLTAAFLVFLMLFPCVCAADPAAGQITFGNLLADLLIACEEPSEEGIARIDADVEALDDELAAAIAEHWKKVYLDPDYKLYLWGVDDPALLPVSGKHAFVILGYQLKDGEMTKELKGRCKAGAAAAKAFPDSILVCSGGATGSNNPDKHTEAGMMKDYLVDKLGISPKRIFIDEKAMTTAENAINTLAILRKQEIETMTIVTSSYHQRWGQVLYNALAAQYRLEYGYTAEIVGNYCYDIKPSNARYRQDAEIAISQLASILGLSREDRQKISDAKKQ